MISFYGLESELDIIINTTSGILDHSLNDSSFVPYRVNNDPNTWGISADGHWQLIIEKIENSNAVKYSIIDKQIFMNKLIHSEEKYSLYMLLVYLAKITVL